MDDITINKADTINRCVERIQEEYQEGIDLATASYSKQDSIILNIQRACEAAIDIGTHVIRKKHLGIPQNNKEIFIILERNKIIDHTLSKKLQAMVGFRNIAVHDYSDIDLDIVKSIIKNNLDDLQSFAKIALQLAL